VIMEVNNEDAKRYWIEEMFKREFYKMYFASPLAREDRPVAKDLGDILDIYSKKEELKNDTLSLLHFSNWMVYKFKEDHGYGILFPLKEMCALVFVMEQVYEIRSGWTRIFYTDELEGGWIANDAPEKERRKQQEIELKKQLREMNDFNFNIDDLDLFDP
jgi:hypothetical protein